MSLVDPGVWGHLVALEDHQFFQEVPKQYKCPWSSPSVPGGLPYLLGVLLCQLDTRIYGISNQPWWIPLFLVNTDPRRTPVAMVDPDFSGGFKCPCRTSVSLHNPCVPGFSPLSVED